MLPKKAAKKAKLPARARKKSAFLAAYEEGGKRLNRR
jgi:hypothetical protein